MEFPQFELHALKGILDNAICVSAAIILMFLILGIPFVQWVWSHRRIEREESSNRFRDIESGCACAGNVNSCNVPSSSHINNVVQCSENIHSATEFGGLAYGSKHCVQGDLSSRRQARYFPMSATYIGTPAALDKMTRLIRATCKLGKAKQPGKCGLCGQDIYDGDVIRTLPCGHHYHNLCILRWLVLSQMNCPDCHNHNPLY